MTEKNVSSTTIPGSKELQMDDDVGLGVFSKSGCEMFSMTSGARLQARTCSRRAAMIEIPLRTLKRSI